MDNEFHRRMRRIEELVKSVEEAPDPELRASGLELIRSLMDFHCVALDRMMEAIVGAGQTGRVILDRFVGDDVIRGVLLLYGLHPIALETRVQQALDRVRPYLRSHGGNVELVCIEQGVAKLRLQGTCSGCPSSRATLDLAVEQAIFESAPDLAAIEVEGVVERELRTEFNGNGTSARSPGDVVWRDVGDVEEFAAEAVRLLPIDGRAVLFCRLGELLYGYRAVCGSCSNPLETQKLEEGAIACPACGQRFDPTQAGRGLSDPAKHLDPVPILVERGQVKVALPRAEKKVAHRF